MTERAKTRSSLRHCLRWIAGVAAAVAVLVFVAAGLLQGNNVLYRENGVLETFSVLLWAASFILSAWSTARATEREDRLAALWTGSLALFAGLRELDFQTWLNPARLGDWGVRYRIKWWLDGSVPLWLKLGWAALFLGVLVLLLYPPFKLRWSAWRLVRRGDLVVGLMLAAFFFMGFGFVIDDLLRGSKMLSLNTRQLLEETSESIGAVLFLLSVFFQWRSPLKERVGGIGSEVEPGRLARQQ